MIASAGHAPQDQSLPCLTPLSGGGWRLAVWVQPGAAVTEPAGFYQECLKVRLAAPPVDGKANKELTSYLAKALGLKKRQVSLVAGHASRKKLVEVDTEEEPAWDNLFQT
jgi:hypothetical protein